MLVREDRDLDPAAAPPKFPHGTVAGYLAGPGWDPVAGRGSPDAQALVPLLASHASQRQSGRGRRYSEFSPYMAGPKTF